MMINLLYYLTYASAVGAGLLAGVFFAFSAFVMQSLAKLPVEKGISAMQSINSTILQSSFMLVFMGTTVLSVVLGIASFIKMGRTSAIYVIVGSLLIIFGVFMVTAIFNVPLNDTLAAATSGSSEGA
ncbi:anthrone oxygenase family protein [Paenibacillus sp. FSL R5-0810]|uniref:anthrone oxygenase family protein n=1 Tax=Paenibacillus sp. FSL R5-0810 TaxID=2921659 RepID=UPI0030FA3C48